MHRINRRLTAAVAVTTMVLTTSTGCGDASNASSAQVTELRYEFNDLRDGGAAQ